ncbi:hypothetical protein [Amycolatopsis lexingtonensis]|uniref:hypothetical protein n=1 Tax=Amycolatopsis lexingtonensis TaxID=218822 RepID=UPI003F7223D8
MIHTEIPTVADVLADPAYWIAGPGRAVADRTDCPHGYRLTSTCPPCDAEQERAAVDAAERGRPLPPPLCTTLPPCTLCGHEVSTDGDGYLCQLCDCWWPLNGLDETPGEWHDEDAEQCESRSFSGGRCYLNAGHSGGWHRNPDHAWTDSAYPAGPARLP